MFIPGQTYLAVRRLIDSVWTLKFKFVGDGVEILSHSRDDIEGYKQEQELPKYNIVEDDSRKALSVRLYQPDCCIFGKLDETHQLGEFQVINPRHIFSYKERESE